MHVYTDSLQLPLAAPAAAPADLPGTVTAPMPPALRGLMEDKVIKNHFASEYIYNKYKDYKTCDIIEESARDGIMKVAEPIGVIAGGFGSVLAAGLGGWWLVDGGRTFSRCHIGTWSHHSSSSRQRMPFHF